MRAVCGWRGRGEFGLAALGALGGDMLDRRRRASALSLFAPAEFGFIALPAQSTAGSSIMPNKRNPDVIELMRGSYASVAAARCGLCVPACGCSVFQGAVVVVQLRVFRSPACGVDYLSAMLQAGASFAS